MTITRSFSFASACASPRTPRLKRMIIDLIKSDLAERESIYNPRVTVSLEHPRPMAAKSPGLRRMLGGKRGSHARRSARRAQGPIGARARGTRARCRRCECAMLAADRETKRGLERVAFEIRCLRRQLLETVRIRRQHGIQLRRVDRNGSRSS